jgi:hypothetical protein
MKPLDIRHGDTGPQQQESPKTAGPRTLPLLVIPLPTGITRADRKRVNDIAPQFLRD